jgi:hypothetical protein
MLRKSSPIWLFFFINGLVCGATVLFILDVDCFSFSLRCPLPGKRYRRLGCRRVDFRLKRPAEMWPILPCLKLLSQNHGSSYITLISWWNRTSAAESE